MSSGSFVSGFAQGFLDQYNRRKDREADMEKIGLQYRLQNLQKEQDKWDEQQEKDKELSKEAKILAAQTGKPWMAQARLAYKNMSVQEILKMYEDGHLQEVAPVSQTVNIPNPELAQNKRAIQADVPAGVDPTLAQQPKLRGETPDQYNAFKKNGVGPTRYETPNPVDDTTTNSTDPRPYPSTWSKDEQEKMTKIDKKIEDMGLGYLLKKREKPEDVDTSNMNFRFVPAEKQTNLPPLDAALYDLRQAVKAGDQEKINQKTEVLQAIQDKMDMEARAKARAEGKLVKTKAIYDKNGKFLNTVPVEYNEQGIPINTSTNKEFVLGEGQTSINVSEKAIENLPDVRKAFQKDSTDYFQAAENTMQALTIGRNMVDIQQRHRNDNLMTTTTGDFLQVVGGIDANLGAIGAALNNQSAALDAKLNDKNASDEDISSQLASYANTFKEFERELSGKAGLLSDKNTQAVVDKTLYENYQKMLAYRIALAQGQTPGKMSNRDYQIALDNVRGGPNVQGSTAQQIIAQQLQLLIQSNDLRRGNLEAQIKPVINSELDGFDPGLVPKRLGQMITDERDRMFLNSIGTMATRARTYTKDALERSDAVDNINQNSSIPRLSSNRDEAISQYNALKPGTQYIDPNGIPKTKPEKK